MNASRSTIVNVGLLALAVASGIALWATRDSQSTSDNVGREQNLLSAFRNEDVISLELSEKDQKIAIERSTAGSDAGAPTFRLTAPVHEPADTATVDKLLGTLSSARSLRPVEGGLPDAQLGLVTPTLRITLHTRQGNHEIWLGGAAPVPEGAHYARVKRAGIEPKTVLLAKSVVEDLAVDLDDFRLRSLVSTTESNVNRLSITSKNLQVTLVHGVGKTFLVDGNPKQRADRELVGSLFFQLARLSASHFLDPAAASGALGADHGHFELQPADTGPPLRFDVGGACPGDPSQFVLLRAEPAAAGCVPRDLEATLALTRDAFVDHHAFALHSDEVEELDISGGPTKFRLVRKGSGFLLRGSTDSDVELEAGNQRISALLEAQGQLVDAAKLTELGLEPEQARVTLRSSAAHQEDVLEEVVRIGKRDGDGNLSVYREQDGAVLRIPREQARAFVPNPALLRARKLVEFGPSSFISAEITRSAGKEVLSRGPDGNLRLEEPKGFEPDGVLATDVVQALGALDAERFVAETDDGTFGLQNPVLSVHFKAKNENQPELEHTLRIGNDTALGVFATLDRDGPVFTLARTVRDTLDLLLINRSIFPAQPSALQGFTLEARGRKLVFERFGDSFSASPKGSFPDERVADLLEALGTLRPEAALHLGPATASEGLGRPTLIVRVTPKLGHPLSLTFGAGDAWRSMSVFYARISGTDATFVVAQSQVRALLDAI